MGNIKYHFRHFFNILDRLHDVLLGLTGKIWRIELLMRGVTFEGDGEILGRPVVKLHPDSFVKLGNGFQLLSNNRRCSSGSIYSACRLQTHGATSKICIGDKVGMNGVSIVSRSSLISIGNGVIMAPNVVIMDSPYHRMYPIDKRWEGYTDTDLDADVVIGDYVWIGAGSLILPGANIGKGCVVASRSVVTKTFPENCLIAGIPAKVIRNIDVESFSAK